MASLGVKRGPEVASGRGRTIAERAGVCQPFAHFGTVWQRVARSGSRRAGVDFATLCRTLHPSGKVGKARKWPDLLCFGKVIQKTLPTLPTLPLQQIGLIRAPALAHAHAHTHPHLHPHLHPHIMHT